MANESIERLYKVVVDGSQATRSLQNIEKSAANTESILSSFGKGLAAGIASIGVAGAISQVVGFLKDTATAMDEVKDAADGLGVAAADLTSLRLAVEVSGGSADKADAALTGLTKSIAEFSTGSKNMIAAFNALGVDPAGKDTVTVLEETADALSKLPDGAQKTAIALELFGKSATAILPALSNGAEGLREFSKQASEFGLILTEGQQKAANDLGDALDRIALKSKGAATQFITGLTPALVDLANRFAEGTGSAEFFQRAGRFVGAMLTEIAEAATIAGKALSFLGSSFSAAWQAIKSGNFSEAGDKIKQQFDELAKANEAAGKKVEAAWAAVKEPVVLGEIDPKGRLPAGTDAFNKLRDAAKAAKPPVDDFKSAMASLVQQYDSMIATSEKFGTLQKLEQDIARGRITTSEKNLDLLRQQATANDELAAAIQRKTEAEKQEADFQDAVVKGNQRTADMLDSLMAKYRDVLDPLAKYADQEREINELRAAGMITTEQQLKLLEQSGKGYFDTLQKMKDAADPLAKAFEELGSTMANAFGQGFADMLLNGEMSFKSFVDSFLKQAARILLNKGIMQLFEGLFGKTGSTSGNIFGTLFGGARATGGPVSSDRAYLVGEKGPELFVPNQNGQIYPSPSGGSLANVNTYITVNNDGSTTTTSDDAALAKKLDAAVKQVIMNEQRPGGMLASTGPSGRSA